MLKFHFNIDINLAKKQGSKGINALQCRKQYLKGANFAVYESIPEEKVKKFIFGLLFVETQQIVDTILEFVTYETKPQNLKGDMF